MREEALTPLEQRTIVFYDDELTAVVVDDGGRRVVYVPIRPICDYLGVDWSGQRQRINRDPVLSDVMRSMSVGVTTTDMDPTSRRPRSSEMLCLPLDFINGWLFGISVNRVKPQIRDTVLRYQLECYRVLADAFLSPSSSPAGEVSTSMASLVQVREMGLAIARMAQEQIEFDGRLTAAEGRLDRAAVVFGDLTKRVTSLESRLAPGEPVTLEQASEISQAVKAIALALGEQTGRNEFGGVYGELYRRFRITSYKLLPAGQFAEAMQFLTEWYGQITKD